MRALLGRADTRRLRGDLRGAMTDATAVTLLAPDVADAYRVRGLAALAAGRDLTPDLERFLALAPPRHPGAPEVQAALEQVRARRR